MPDPASPRPGAIAAVRDRLWRHPDLAALLLLLVVALVPRLAFNLLAPAFVVRDSIAYYQAGHDLAFGQGFDLPFKRTPLYPLFIAGVVALLGEQLERVTLVQHLLGLMTVALTYALGRAVFGRLAGLAAGLLVALSGPQIVYEHYILTEPLFTLLLVAFGLCLVYAVRRGSLPWLVLSGILLGLAGLARPVGQAVLLALPPALFLAFRSGRRAALASLVVAVGMALSSVPWMARNYLENGSFETAGALGQTLVGRIVWHDYYFQIPSPESPSPYSDPVRTAARALILQEMARRELRPSFIHGLLMETFGWTEAQANRAMRDTALEIIVDQKEYYLQGTLKHLLGLLEGERDDFRAHWSSRKKNNIADDWERVDSIKTLLPFITPEQEEHRESAKAIVTFFWPYRSNWALLALLLVGTAVALRTPSRWAAVFCLLLLFAIVVPSAALVGDVPRYRYPVDPFLTVLIGGGAAWLARLAARGSQFSVLGSLRRTRRRTPTPAA